ncbi:MAG TPA: hypothetical protein VLT92_11380 [Burkholderiales bacterium]|jgi:hypothetical protein|nr:hypothetical protein [Burkholderiales bacterium]
MKRIALKLLLSLALILQGVSAFGLAPVQHVCCCHSECAAHAHCRHGHGTPCKSSCAQHCIGCATTAFISVPAVTAIAPSIFVAAAPRESARAHTRDALPPTRPPIV